MLTSRVASLAALLLVADGKHLHQSREIVQKGGWSLTPAVASGGCPALTSSCFGDQTGNNRTSLRGENCCPTQQIVYNNEYGQQVQTPLYCGTYVNTGQPYACCPLGNADCRGDVGASADSQKCANSGWAQWLVPDGGFNHFCCLPGQYGYWFPAYGQDAVGQCSNSRTLPRGAQPAQQIDNGDGTVGPDGAQLAPIATAQASPAPVCDIIANYGWSLQVSDASQCTSGSFYCGYGTACCPNALNCGTVIGDSEVPVCCPADNPDCRGAVEGLAVQLCADSAWSLWHINTNGNHFCCKPGQIGYNVPNDNNATGFCGSAVPPGSMRSILDYPGDGSTAGSNEAFPCDTDPQPLQSLPAIISAILGPTATAIGDIAFPTLQISFGNTGDMGSGNGSGTANATVTSVYTTTVTTCPGDNPDLTLTYLVAGSVISGTRIPLASQIVISNPTSQVDIIATVMASAYSYTMTAAPLPSSVPGTNANTNIPATSTDQAGNIVVVSTATGLPGNAAASQGSSVPVTGATSVPAAYRPLQAGASTLSPRGAFSNAMIATGSILFSLMLRAAFL